MNEQLPTEYVPPVVGRMNKWLHEAPTAAIDATLGFISDHKKGIVEAMAFTTALSIGAAACSGSTESQNPGTTIKGTAPTTEAVGSPNAEDMKLIKEALTVNAVGPNVCVDIVGKTGGKTVKPKEGKTIIPPQSIGALVGVDPNNNTLRTWSDSIDTPFTADKADKAALLTEIQAEICENPLVGTMVANEFANMQVGEVKVVDLNPWLDNYKGPAEDMNKKAKEFMPTFGKDPLEVSDDEAKDAMRKNYAYQELAGNLATMLERFQNNGNQDAGMTIFNYHLSADGLVVDGLSQISLNPDQYPANGDVSALVLELTKKPGDCVLRIGFNIKDKRMEGFECAVPDTNTGDTTPDVTTTVNTTPGQPTVPSVTTVPGVNTTTTKVGPKGDPHPPVTGGAPTTVEAPVPQSDPVPTVRPTTAPKPTQAPSTISPVPTNVPPTTQPVRP